MYITIKSMTYKNVKRTWKSNQVSIVGVELPIRVFINCIFILSCHSLFIIFFFNTQKYTHQSEMLLIALIFPFKTFVFYHHRQCYSNYYLLLCIYVHFSEIKVAGIFQSILTHYLYKPRQVPQSPYHTRTSSCQRYWHKRSCEDRRQTGIRWRLQQTQSY